MARQWPMCRFTQKNIMIGLSCCMSPFALFVNNKNKTSNHKYFNFADSNRTPIIITIILLSFHELFVCACRLMTNFKISLMNVNLIRLFLCNESSSSSSHLRFRHLATHIFWSTLWLTRSHCIPHRFITCFSLLKNYRRNNKLNYQTACIMYLSLSSSCIDRATKEVRVVRARMRIIAKHQWVK